jgi:hypothetical protein
MGYYVFGQNNNIFSEYLPLGIVVRGGNELPGKHSRRREAGSYSE